VLVPTYKLRHCLSALPKSNLISSVGIKLFCTCKSVPVASDPIFVNLNVPVDESSDETMLVVVVPELVKNINLAVGKVPVFSTRTCILAGAMNCVGVRVENTSSAILSFSNKGVGAVAVPLVLTHLKSNASG
jgi:hypothetical protein